MEFTPAVVGSVALPQGMALQFGGNLVGLAVLFPVLALVAGFSGPAGSPG